MQRVEHLFRWPFWERERGELWVQMKGESMWVLSSFLADLVEVLFYYTQNRGFNDRKAFDLDLKVNLHWYLRPSFSVKLCPHCAPRAHFNRTQVTLYRTTIIEYYRTSSSYVLRYVVVGESILMTLLYLLLHSGVASGRTFLHYVVNCMAVRKTLVTWVFLMEEQKNRCWGQNIIYYKPQQVCFE